MQICKFFLFLATLIHLAIFGTILQISKICNFGKLEFFRIPQRVGTLSDVWGQFVNFRNLQQLTSFFSESFFILTDEIYAKIAVYISFIRLCSFGRSKLLQTWMFWYFSTNWHIQERLRPFVNFENFKIFLVFLLEIFFLNVKKIPIFKYFSVN